MAMAMLRNHPILITAGQDGALHAYSTETHVLLARYVFPTAISCMLYPPIDVSLCLAMLLDDMLDSESILGKHE